jgi:hypothetical protein
MSEYEKVKRLSLIKKRISEIEIEVNDITDKGTTVGGIGLGGLFLWGMIFFIIGLFTYGNLDGGIKLGIFAIVSLVMSVLYILPILGLILFIIGQVGEWGVILANILDISPKLATGVAWYFPAIVSLTIGIGISLFVILGILALIFGD